MNARHDAFRHDDHAPRAPRTHRTKSCHAGEFEHAADKHRQQHRHEPPPDQLAQDPHRVADRGAADRKERSAEEIRHFALDQQRPQSTERAIRRHPEDPRRGPARQAGQPQQTRQHEEQEHPAVADALAGKEAAAHDGGPDLQEDAHALRHGGDRRLDIPAPGERDRANYGTSRQDRRRDLPGDMAEPRTFQPADLHRRKDRHQGRPDPARQVHGPKIVEELPAARDTLQHRHQLVAEPPDKCGDAGHRSAPEQDRGPQALAHQQQQCRERIELQRTCQQDDGVAGHARNRPTCQAQRGNQDQQEHDQVRIAALDGEHRQAGEGPQHHQGAIGSRARLRQTAE